MKNSTKGIGVFILTIVLLASAAGQEYHYYDDGSYDYSYTSGDGFVTQHYGSGGDLQWEKAELCTTIECLAPESGDYYADSGYNYDYYATDYYAPEYYDGEDYYEEDGDTGFYLGASWGSWNNYWNGYRWVTPTYGHYDYYQPYVQHYVDYPVQEPNIIEVDCGDDCPKATSTQRFGCGDGWCSQTETPQSCPADCDVYSYCGDGRCNDGETAGSCPWDCKAEEVKYCGDGICNNGETKYSCSDDCGTPAYCGDGSCNGAETKLSCPEDCGLTPYCGDGSCNGAESKYNCAMDCGLPPYCGDGTCDLDETTYTCSIDCGEPECTNPYGGTGATRCSGRQILVCENGFWDFQRSVQCCRDADCPSGYYCGDYACEKKVSPKRCDTNFCGDGICECPENERNCPEDCGRPAPPPRYCGDGICSSNEDCSSCPADCGVCDYCGDGVCNMPKENQQNCPKDCGEAIEHILDISIFEECEEIVRGESDVFTLQARNGGDATETLILTVDGEAASWVSQKPSLTVYPKSLVRWDVKVGVPEGTEPGLYEFRVTAQNAKVSDSLKLYVDVKLPPLGGEENVTTTEAGAPGEEAITGGVVIADVFIPDLFLLIALLVVIAAVLGLLLSRSLRGRRAPDKTRIERIKKNVIIS